MTSSLPGRSGQVAQEPRFDFGRNWSRYLTEIDHRRIATATTSLIAMLGRARLDDQSFLDVGCGSGIFSLAARRLGARVHSFDYDPQSVAATRALRNRERPDDADWTVERGDVLDVDFLERLGRFDIVYAWGVLHHTGDMWRALRHVADLPRDHGQLFIAIYNDQGPRSKVWRGVKRFYNHLPEPARPLVLVPAFARLWGPTSAKDLLRGRPNATWRHYREERGMSPWRDTVDWVGGYPFEVATPASLRSFFEELGYGLEREHLVGRGLGCNEFVFRRGSE